MKASWTPWVLVTHKHNQKVQLESKQPPSTQQQATPSTQQRSAITENGNPTKEKKWSSDEDKFLIAAWANTSLDIVETNQNEMLIALEFQSTTTHTRNHHGRSVMLMQ